MPKQPTEAEPTRSVRIERVGLGHPDAVLLTEGVQEEYVMRYGQRDDTPLDPHMFEPPEGSFFVGYLDEVPVACGAWRTRSDVEALGTTRTAEVKRMYVVAEARRAGRARRMLAHLEDTAAAAGAEVMILQTGPAQPESIALYESAGYTPIPPFGWFKDFPQVRCFARPLT